MKHISIDVADDQKAAQLVALLSGLDYIARVEVQDISTSPQGTIRSQVTFAEHSRQDEMCREMIAYELLHSTLVNQYLGEFVAVHHGEIIDHDFDEEKLLDRIQSEHPNAIVLIEKVCKELHPPLKIRDRQLTT